MSDRNETTVLDTVQQNIVNRIAPGSEVNGTLRFNGGLIIEGQITGDLSVQGGPVILMAEGVFAGTMRCDQDVFLLGTINGQDGGSSVVEAAGTIHLAYTLRADADMTAEAINSQPGAQVEGRMKTRKVTPPVGVPASTGSEQQ